MVESDALSFGALARPGQSSLAYWVGPCDVAGLDGVGAGGLTDAMAYQYGVEEQADRLGSALARDVDWLDHFAPVAPVQLARDWSPLPAAVEMLGAPDFESVEVDGMGTRAAACAWRSVGSARRTGFAVDDPDQERFRKLLAVTVTRAEGAGRGALIVVKPGWSYDRTHEAGAITRQLMRDAGFVFTEPFSTWRRPHALTQVDGGQAAGPRSG